MTKLLENRLWRAQALVDQMIRAGLVDKDAVIIGDQLKEILGWNDEGLAAMERVVAKYIATH